MNRLINISTMALAVFSTGLIAGELSKDRYKNYQFTPIYSEDVSDAATNALNQYLSDWRYVRKLHGATRWGEMIEFLMTQVLIKINILNGPIIERPMLQKVLNMNRQVGPQLVLFQVMNIKSICTRK